MLKAENSIELIYQTTYMLNTGYVGNFRDD